MSYSYGVGQGTNFGLNDYLEYYEIYLDSLDATTSNDSDYTSQDWPLFQLNTPIPNLGGMKVIEVQIPFSFYIINSTNNEFQLTVGASTYNVILAVGNYNSTTLTTELQAALNAAGSALTFTVVFSGMNSSPNTGKFTVTATGAFTLQFGANTSDPGIFNPRFWLGFNGGTISSTSVSGTQTVVAPNVANIAGPNYLYLNSRALGPVLKTVLPAGAVNLGKGSAGPQIAKIPINVQPGGVIYWSDPDPLYWFELNNLPLLTQFDMYITIGNNENPQATTLNGLSFSVKLGLIRNKITVEQSYQGASGGFPASTVIGARKRTANF